MRLFRYLDTVGALLTIEQKALRVSRLHDLNDPFEWRIGVTNLIEGVQDLADAMAESALREISRVTGLISFSAVPDESVLWSHYADRHRGMVLELEVPDDPMKTVKMTYTDERPHVDPGKIADTTYMKAKVDQIIRQKSTGWSYEQEYRVYVSLADCDARGGHYYTAFEPGALKQIIIGWRSNTDVQYVQRVLSLARYSDVTVRRAALQSESYKIKC